MGTVKGVSGKISPEQVAPNGGLVLGNQGYPV